METTASSFCDSLVNTSIPCSSQNSPNSSTNPVKYKTSPTFNTKSCPTSTRKEDGAAVDQPFEFQPGVGLIQGWTDGVLQMNIGERAYLHVPSALGYGSNPMGSQGGAFYIPANSNLLFDIEILGIVGETEL